MPSIIDSKAAKGDLLPDRKAAYLAAEGEARAAGRGLWQGEFVLPTRF